MIGVVVWSSGSREKAIIWCEDHATLAYLQGRDNMATAGGWPQPGDLVELETTTIGNLRHALGVAVISERSCTQIPGLLAQAAPQPSASSRAPLPAPRLRVVLDHHPDPRPARPANRDAAGAQIHPMLRTSAAAG